MNLLQGGPKQDLERLRQIVSGSRRVLLLFSGGVDSTLLLKVAAEILGEKLTALTFRGPHWPARELEAARETARSLQVRHREEDFDPFAVPEFAHNTPQRCYACKRALYGRALQVLAEWGGGEVWDGAQADDREGDRPGLTAAAELGVASPLRAAGLGKEQVRALSRALGLPAWNRPSQSCLATRFTPHTTLTPELLSRVAAVEEWLAGQGFAPVRLRVHGDLVRLELDPDQWPRLLAREHLGRLEEVLAQEGWLYATLDLKGYQSGSMNARSSPDRAGSATPPDRPRD